ncbi:MAG: protein-tyrosine-phosphatase, partial [Halieaceae bacterium]|nr:protein-tyrosine-phosphatase [Halieaceae bacterium]
DMPVEAMLPMLEVHEDYLGGALRAIRSRHTSVEAYLADELEVGAVELEELRGRYLV